MLTSTCAQSTTVPVLQFCSGPFMQQDTKPKAQDMDVKTKTENNKWIPVCDAGRCVQWYE